MGCGSRVKIFSPSKRGINNWTMNDKMVLRDMLRLCDKCWISFISSKEGKSMCKNWDEVKTKYLENSAYWGKSYVKCGNTDEG